MKALNYDESVKESVMELRVLHQKQSHALFRSRLQFLMLLKSGKCSSQAKPGALIGIEGRASEKFWKLYVTEGLEGLLRLPDKSSPACGTGSQPRDNPEAGLQLCRAAAWHHDLTGRHALLLQPGKDKKEDRPSHQHPQGPARRRAV